MTQTLPESVDRYVRYDRLTRVHHSRFLEEQRRLATARGPLLRQALDDTSLNVMKDAANVSMGRLYQLMASKGWTPTRDKPATPLEAVVVPRADGKSRIAEEATWDQLRRSVSPSLARVLRMQWQEEWDQVFVDAGLDPAALSDEHMKGPISWWWFHIAPQTIEAAFHVNVE